MAQRFFGMLCLGFCTLLLAAFPAHAEPESQELEELVVTSGRFPERTMELTTDVIVVDEQQIQASPTRDLGELLAEINIGNVRLQPGTLTPLGIRGFRTESHGNDLMGRVLILLNGRRAGTGNAAKIMTENIERVEIIRGPASVQYGSAALGGVINVITKQGRGDPEGFVQGRLGSFGYAESGAGFSGEKQGFDFSGAVSRSSMDDYNTGDGEQYINTGYDQKDSINLNLGYEILPRHRIGLLYNRFDAESVGTSGYINDPDPDAYKDSSNESVDFVYDGIARDGLFAWQAKYFLGQDQDHWKGTDFPYEQKADHSGAQGQLTWDPEQYRLTAGLDWVNYEINSDFDPQETEFNNPAYFLLGKAQYLEDRLIFSGGLRYDEYKVEVKKGQGGTERDSQLCPRLGAGYFLLENLKLRVNYGQGFKMPDAQQLAGKFESWGVMYEGNPDLDPEKSQTYEGGLDWYGRAWEASLTFFRTDFKDKIQEVTRDDWVQTWDNIGDAKISGFEGEISFDLGRFLNHGWQIAPFVNFTYLTEYEDKETGDDLLYTSDMHLSYGLMVSDYDGLSARLALAYTGPQKVQDWQSAGPPDYVAPVVKKGGFTVANVSLQKRILDIGSYGGLSLRGEVRNLLDKQYAHVKGFPMPGRSIVLGAEYKF